MAVYLFAEFVPELLEKIITKVEDKSQFRLRLTCWDRNEFIEKLRNILLKGEYHLQDISERKQYKRPIENGSTCHDETASSLISSMTGFLLCQLVPSHLEKVINKLEAKSYLRLQQTCREVRDFIRNNRHILIRLDGDYRLLCSRKDWGCYMSTMGRFSFGIHIRPETLYSTRLGTICSLEWAALSFYNKQNEENPEAFKEFCISLKKNRVTCDRMILKDMIFNAEQCAQLIKTLKPTRVEMNSRYTDRFEALFRAKTLDSVEVTLDPIDAVFAAERLFPSCQSVTLHVPVYGSRQFHFFNKMLQMIFSMKLPKPLQLLFTARWDVLPTKDELEELLDEFHVADVATHNWCISASIGLPPQFPFESSCTVAVKCSNPTQGATISCSLPTEQFP